MCACGKAATVSIGETRPQWIGFFLFQHFYCLGESKVDLYGGKSTFCLPNIYSIILPTYSSLL